MSVVRQLTGIAARAAAGVLLFAVCATPSPAAAALPEASAPDRAWISSPERRFGAAQVLVPGRAVLYDEVDDPSLAVSLAAEVRRVRASLFGTGGWRSPLPDDEPLRIYVARRPADGMRRIASSAPAPGAGRASGPALMLDASRMTDDEIAREVARQIARATLAGYGVAPDPFLESALSEWLAASGGDASGSDAWAAAASPELDVAAQPASLGRLWLDEVARAAGSSAFLREAWEKAAETGEPPRAVVLRLLSERSRVGEDQLLARFGARLYARIEPEASPSRLRALDLESGALDGSAPQALRIRHRSFLPEGAEDTLRVEWPEDAAAGAAVVRYRDEALPADAVFFTAGDRRAIPLAGVARVDFLVAGSALGGGELRAPVRVERTAAVPYSGLDAHVSSAPDGPRVWWTTASHEGLWGWAIFREEVLADGRVVRTGPEIVPSTESSPGSYRYAYVDRTSSPGTFYRYTVWAVTDEGLLARAFAATLKSD